MGVVRRAAPLLGVVAVVAVVAGCGGGGGGGPEVIGTTVPGATEITVVATDFAYEPSTIELAAGEPVNVVLQVEEGGHDLVVADAGFRIPILDAPDSAVATLVVAEPGTYAFQCNVPGHAAQGMVGTITVR